MSDDSRVDPIHGTEPMLPFLAFEINATVAYGSGMVLGAAVTHYVDAIPALVVATAFLLLGIGLEVFTE